MNITDIFYLEWTTGAVANLFTPSGDGTPYLHDESIRIYIDPLAFEKHVKTLPEINRASEFRNAYDIIVECIERADIRDEVNGIPVMQIFNSAIICLHTLATAICSEIAQEICPPVAETPQINTDTTPILPTEINSDRAIKLLGALVEAGYLNENYQPENNVKAKTLAYIAKYIGSMLYITNWSNVFTRFWGLNRPLSQDFLNINRKIKDRQFPVTADKDAEPINRIFAEIVRDDYILKSTGEGKNLLKIYRN